uniref:Uncharacterized protein n=1 Tax=Romanomermis culicivorax TaxID=13658 RepID=A0A915KP04_ROMCU
MRLLFITCLSVLILASFELPLPEETTLSLLEQLGTTNYDELYDDDYYDEEATATNIAPI